MTHRLSKTAALCAVLAIGSLASCSSSSEPSGSVPAASTQYVVFAWNDLGMHCLNPSYDTMVILPPYNTVWAQVVKRAPVPQLVTTGITVEYRLVGNTGSAGKGLFGQFWQYAQRLFGAAPAIDKGLNLRQPGVSNGLSGRLVLDGDHWVVDGIPAVPIGDDGVWNPFQVAEITVKDATTGAVLVTTRATVPTSDEFSCNKCHGADPFNDILARHDADTGSTLAAQKPVLCASCHASPALGIPARTGGHAFLSEAIHGFHGKLAADQRPACYDCHPGPKTQCTRSLAHTAPDGNCTHCHGALPEVAASIASNARVPWVNEPACVKCHAGVPEVDTGATLYRNAKGHGRMSCPACHGSPHAMIPSRVASDHAQALQYQAAAVPIGDCNACHDNSRGGGSASEFMATHAGSGAEAVSACAVCHTDIPGPLDLARWPHGFAWKSRSIR
jgi:hypothetical protein